MSLIDDIIKISITIGEVSVTREGFGTILIIGHAVPNLDPKVKSYTTLEGVLAVFADNTPEYIIASKIFGQDLKPSRVLIGQKTNDESYLEAYSAIKQIDNNFYGVITEPLLQVDVLALSQAIEADRKIYGLSSDQPAILTNADNDNILKTIKGQNRRRTFVFYSGHANEDRPDAAIMGKMFARDPGSETWAYQNLSGVRADNLTDTARGNIILSNGNYYQPFGGSDRTHNGKMTSGHYIDTIHGVDWLHQYMQDNFAKLLNGVGKIPANQSGSDLVENSLRASLQEAVNRNIIDSTYKVTVGIPNKTTRTLALAFEATTTGAIHNLTIKGTITE